MLYASRSSSVCERFVTAIAAYQGTQCKFSQLFLMDSIFILGSLVGLNFIIPLRLVFAYHVPTLRVITNIADAIELRCDNNGAFAETKEPKISSKIQTYS
ncbi:hypothetical protein V6N12_031611 [Hibiscus sabdariffa]|uniref:Uncharacterized protein n=1 Tax=Hibiscus sabdariffa TaxID=183260 RepID=A0ABR2DYD3_9ROSI